MSFNCDRKSVITLPAAVAQRSALRCTGWKVVGSNPIRMINYQIFRALIGYYVEMGVLKVSGKARITQPSFVHLTDVSWRVLLWLLESMRVHLHVVGEVTVYV